MVISLPDDGNLVYFDVEYTLIKMQVATVSSTMMMEYDQDRSITTVPDTGVVGKSGVVNWEDQTDSVAAHRSDASSSNSASMTLSTHTTTASGSQDLSSSAAADSRGSSDRERARRIGCAMENELRSSLLKSRDEVWKSEKLTKAKSGFTTLKFHTLGLHGRDQQTAILDDCLQQVAAAAGADSTPSTERGSEDENHKNLDVRASRHLVWIGGRSGAGKTALARHVSKPTRKKYGGLFVTGKFDDSHVRQHDEPYKGLANACREILGEILSLKRGPERLYAGLAKKILNELGDELSLLLPFLPELSELAQANPEDSFKRGGGFALDKNNDIGFIGNNSNDAKARFHFAFRRFIRVAASSFAPLVMFLDDLQWADPASLELIDVLITDRDNPHLMIIGAYRDDELVKLGVDNDGRDAAEETSLYHHPLAQTMMDLDDKSEEYGYRISKLSVGNLDVDDVNRVIVDLFSMDDSEKTKELASLCHKRTSGNVFFLIVFLNVLKDDSLLEYDIGRFKWKWDIQEINEKTAATSNVVGIVKSEMQKQPPNVTWLLAIAACLGSVFEKHILHIVWTNMPTTIFPNDNEADPIEIDFDVWIERVVEEGFIECQTKNTEEWYRFVHDMVQESAKELVDPTTFNNLKYQVGLILATKLSGDEINRYIFPAVDLLNGWTIEDSRRVWLAELNLKATKKAHSLSAFIAASKYVKVGVDLLPTNDPTNCWLEHGELMVQLYTYYAEIADYLGETEVVEEFCNGILNRRERPVVERLPVYVTKSQHQSNTGRSEEALGTLSEALKLVNIRLPMNKMSQVFHLLPGLIKVKGILKKLPEDGLSKLSVLKDPVKLQTMKILDRLAFYAYLYQQTELFGVAILKMIRMSLEHGVCEYTAVALAYFGAVVGMTGDYPTAAKIGDEAMMLLKKLDSTGSRYVGCRTIFTAHIGIFPHTKPIKNSLQALLEGYKLGMSSGDTENATFCIQNFMGLAFQSGRSLQLLAGDFRTYAPQMKELKRDLPLDCSKISWQAVLNLTEPVEDPTCLKGSGFDDDDTSLDANRLVNVVYYRGRLLVTFREYEQGAEFALKYAGFFVKVSPIHPLLNGDTFIQGVALYAAAQKTKKRKYAVAARKVHRQLEACLKKGNPNVRHYVTILDAEFAVLRGKRDDAERLYQSAILHSSRSGFVHDAALASERYLNLLHNNYAETLTKASSSLSNDDADAIHQQQEVIYRFKETIKYYDIWGAHAKVNQLRKLYPDLNDEKGPPSTVIEEQHSGALTNISSIMFVPSSKR